MRILVVNLTRFGDLLQTQATISGLAAMGHTVGLVCLDNFAPATALLQHVSHVSALPGARLLAGLDSDWRTASTELHTWARQLRHEFAADAVLNLTATLAGRLLSRLLLAGHARLLGFGMDEHGFGTDGDTWATFLQAATRHRGCSPFNLADIMRRVAGCRDGEPSYALRQPASEAMSDMKQRLHETTPPTARGHIAFQLGASEEKRRWPVASFVRLGQLFWEQAGLCPVLLGSAAERHLSERYQSATRAPSIDLVGKTSLPELAATLRHVEGLVTNDTGTMHLAAGLGTPLLAVFLATAQPWDTGPCLLDACCLEPDMACHPCAFGSSCTQEHACRTTIEAGEVFALFQHRLRHGEWSNEAPTAGKARIWLTRQDANGFLDLASLSGHGDAARSVWIQEQRHFYRQFLDHESMATTPAPHGTLPAPVRDNALDTLQQAMALLHLLSQQGSLLAVRPSELAKQRFLATCGRLHTLFENSRLFNVLGHLWVAESQTAGGSLDELLALATRYKTLCSIWQQHLESMTASPLAHEPADREGACRQAALSSQDPL